MNTRQVIVERTRNMQEAHGGLATESPWVRDEELIRTLVSLGQPQWAARRDVPTPQGRQLAMFIWLDVQDAAEGDKKAQEKLDFLKAQWDQMRRQELISDNPMRQADLMIDPRTLL